jgi:hypothetical protein
LQADIPALVQRLNELEEDRAKDRQRISELDHKAKTYEKTLEDQKIEKQRSAIIDKVCKPLDEKYGAKYRSAAKQLGDQWVEEGIEPAPQDALDARDLMTKAYEHVVTQGKSKTPSKPKGPPQDSGAASTVFGDLPTEGTRQEVLAAMRKKYNRSG